MTAATKIFAKDRFKLDIAFLSIGYITITQIKPMKNITIIMKTKHIEFFGNLLLPTEIIIKILKMDFQSDFHYNKD